MTTLTTEQQALLEAWTLKAKVDSLVQSRVEAESKAQAQVEEAERLYEQAVGQAEFALREVKRVEEETLERAKGEARSLITEVDGVLEEARQALREHLEKMRSEMGMSLDMGSMPTPRGRISL